MFEGKNIHYASDSKLLCSFSNKLCRQRRLNGYGFCIRHILEDKSAPFKQCDYVTSRNNSQKCLNAIPSNQERGYCHSHMQVVGIIPKTERKSKANGKSGDSFNAKDKSATHSQGEQISSNGVTTNFNSNHSINKVKGCKKKSKVTTSNPNPIDKLQLNHSSTFEQNNNHDNTHSINFVKVNGLSNNVNPLELVPQHQHQNNVSESGKSKATTKRGKTKQNDPSIRKTKPVPTTTNKKKKVQLKSNAEMNDGKMTIHDRWKSFKFNKIDAKNEVEKFKDLRLMKIMEKLPLFADATKRREKNEIIQTSSSSFSYQQDQKHNNSTDKSGNIITDKVNTSAIVLQLPKVDRHLDVEVRLQNRKNFLRHVSSAFKSHLKTIRRASKLSRRKDEDDEALRKSLLSCSLTHPKQCAQVLMSGTLVTLASDNTKHEQLKSTKAPTANTANAWTKNPLKTSTTSTSPAAVLGANLIEDSKPSHNQMLGMCNTFISTSNMKHDMNNVIGANGLINLIDPNHTELKLLAELNDEQNLLLHGKLCDSSPWMNGGMMDIDGEDDEYSLSQGLLSSTKGSKDFPELSASESRMLMNMTSSAPSTSKMLGKNNLHKSSQLGYHDITSESSIYGVGTTESITKRRPEFQAIGLQSTVDPNLNLIRQNGVAGPSAHQSPSISVQPFCPDYPTVSHLENALRSPIGSTNPPYATVANDSINNVSVFDSFEPSVSVDQPPDCNFNDDVADLEDNFIPIDQEIANQASQLLEDNGFTEDDFTDLFPETRSLTDHKFGDLGLDFGTTFDTGDIDCAFLVNSFPNVRSNSNAESIPVTPNY